MAIFAALCEWEGLAPEHACIAKGGGARLWFTCFEIGVFTASSSLEVALTFFAGEYNGAFFGKEQSG